MEIIGGIPNKRLSKLKFLYFALNNNNNHSVSECYNKLFRNNKFEHEIKCLYKNIVGTRLKIIKTCKI